MDDNNNNYDFPERLSYRFPDPTDPTQFYPIEPNSSSIHSSIQQPSNKSKSQRSKLSSISTHQLTHSSYSKSLQHHSPSSTPSLSASPIHSSYHQLETDWSILSLKNQSSSLQPRPSYQPPLNLPIHHPSTSPIQQINHHPPDPNPLTPPTAHPSLPLQLQSPDQASKCQIWLESLTNTSEFSYQASEPLAPSSTDQLHDSYHHSIESPPGRGVSQPTNQEVNCAPTRPDHKPSSMKPEVESTGPLAECFLDPSMDLSSSYLEPDQLVKPKSISLDPHHPQPRSSSSKANSAIHSQVLPSSKLNYSSSSQPHLAAERNLDSNPSSNASHGGLPSSHNIPTDPKDSRRLFLFNRWTLVFHLIWPIPLAFYIFSRYLNQPTPQRFVRDSTEHDSMKLIPESHRVPLPRSSGKDDLDDLKQEDLVPELDLIWNQPPLIPKQEEQVLAPDGQLSSLQAALSHADSELNHQSLHHEPRPSIEDTEPQFPPVPANDFDRIRQIVHSSEISPSHDSPSQSTRLNHQQDLISPRRAQDIDPKVMEPFDPASTTLTNQPLPQTPRVDTPQQPSSLPTPAVVFLFAGFLIIFRSFLLNRKSNGDSRTAITAEQLISKLDSSSLISTNVVTLVDLSRISMDHLESTKLIKNLENRIRMSKKIPRVELGLLAWFKQQVGDVGGSEKLWWRFWNDGDESRHFDMDVELAKDSSGLLKTLIEYYSQCPDGPIIYSKLEQKKASITESKADEMVKVKLEQVETPPMVKQKVKTSKPTLKLNLDTSNNKNNSQRKKSVKTEEELKTKKEKEFKPCKLNPRDIKIKEGKGEEEEGSDGNQSDRTLLPQKPSLLRKQEKKHNARNSTTCLNPEQLLPPQIDPTKKRKQRQSEPFSLPSLASRFGNLQNFDSVETSVTRRSSARLKKP